jgi:hypothetical protein
MFWSALHGAIQLQIAGMLAPPYDAGRLSGEIMRTLWIGLKSPSS